MKVSREQAALNRERVVEVAARLFRERGYDGIGVADLMKSAGLTHGGFYGQFESKQDLLTEACQHAVNASLEHWSTLRAQAPQAPLDAITSSYVSARHRDAPGQGCSMAAMGTDVGRLTAPARDVMTQGAQAQIGVLAELVPGDDPTERRQRAIATYAAMVGALVLSRAVGSAALSDEILQAVAAELKQPQGS